MLDRLADLRKSEPSHSPEADEAGRNTSVEYFGGEKTHDVVLQVAEEIQKLLNQLDRNIQLLGGRYDGVNESVASGTARMEERALLVSDTNKLAVQLASQLKDIQQNLDNNLSANARIHRNMHSLLSRRFYQLMRDYQAIKSKNVAIFRAQVCQQVEIMHGQKPTEEELDRLVQAGSVGNLFAKSVLSSDKHSTDARNVLYHLRDQRNDVVQLEKAIDELHGIFVEFSLLVEQQGDMINVIENAVNNAQEYTEEAVHELRAANKTIKRCRRRKCVVISISLCCCCIVVIVVLIILLLRYL